MSKTFDFQGGGKNIRIADIKSDADVVVSAAKPVEDFDARRVEHRTASDDQRNAVSVLFLLASPKDQGELWLDEEMRAVKQGIDGAAYGSEFSVAYAFAPRATDLVRELSRHRPQIIHFSGHGDTAGLAFVAHTAGTTAVDTDALAATIDACSEHVKLVVLNSCESAVIAEALAKRVDLAVGMSKSIGDEGAQTFASGLYTSLASGDSVQMAFDKGKAQMQLTADPDADVPQLYARADVDPRRLILAGPDAIAA